MNSCAFIKSTLEKVCSLVTDGTHDTPQPLPHGYPLIKAKEIVGGKIDFENCAFISEEEHQKVIARSKPEKGDTLFAHIGASLGETAYVNTTLEFSIKNIALFKPNPHVILGRYLYYLTISPQFQSLAKSTRTGSAQPFLSLGHLRNHPIRFHRKIEDQANIAFILSAYDDLIENNLRRIKILEEMAQTLYREWFVKFRFPGHEKTRMVDSPMGKIPEEWEVVPLDSLITEHIGGGWGNDIEDDKHTEPAWVIRGTDIPDARSCNFSKVPFRYHTNSNLKSRRLSPGDIIFEVSGGSKGQPLGRSLYVSSELLAAFKGDCVICASFCKRIQPDTKQYASELLYLSFLDAYVSGEIEQFQVQSTGISNYKWSDYMEKASRCVPPVALQGRFRELCAQLFSQVATLGRKNTTLRRTRDLLLPKLISGELDVSDLDIKTGGHVQ